MSSLLDFVQNDVMDVVIDDSYQDQQNPAPVPAGNYTVKITRFKGATTQQGEPILRDDTYPVIVIEQVEIIEPVQFAGRKVALYQNLETKPSKRQRGGSDVADSVRALDATRTVQGLRELVATFEELAGAGLPMNVRLDWEARDGDWVKAALDAKGLGGVRYGEMDDDSKKVAGEIYNASQIRGMRNFPKNADGSPNHEWTGPGGEVIEGRVRIVRFFPSTMPFRPKLD